MRNKSEQNSGILKHQLILFRGELIISLFDNPTETNHLLGHLETRGWQIIRDEHQVEESYIGSFS